MNPTVKKVWFKPYNYIVRTTNTTYHVKKLGVSRRNLVTINSKSIWAIKSGVQDGLKYKTFSTHIVNLSAFLTLENPVIVFKEQPYKILKYINESEVIDISTEHEVHNIRFASSLNAFLQEIMNK